jgi:acyl-coenzyme A thioesterase PaaI-like protein
MFESVETYAERVGHGPLVRFIRSSQSLHDRLGIDTRDVEYDEVSGVLRASMIVTAVHQGTAYGEHSIMYGMVIAAFADMFTGATAYIRAGASHVVNHAETRIRYTGHVHIVPGTRICTEVNISRVRSRLRSLYCKSVIYQEFAGRRREVATVWATIPSMLEKTFERLVSRVTHL